MQGAAGRDGAPGFPGAPGDPVSFLCCTTEVASFPGSPCAQTNTASDRKLGGEGGGGEPGNKATTCMYKCGCFFVFLTGAAWHRWNPWSSGSERREGTDFLLMFFYGATYIM